MMPRREEEDNIWNGMGKEMGGNLISLFHMVFSSTPSYFHYYGLSVESVHNFYFLY